MQRHFDEVKEKPREELRPSVRGQIANARSYELSTERQIMIYVTIAWLLGSKFDTEFSDVQERLKYSEHSPNEKVEWLFQWAKEKVSKNGRN